MSPIWREPSSPGYAIDEFLHGHCEEKADCCLGSTARHVSWRFRHRNGRISLKNDISKKSFFGIIWYPKYRMFGWFWWFLELPHFGFWGVHHWVLPNPTQPTRRRQRVSKVTMPKTRPPFRKLRGRYNTAAPAKPFLQKGWNQLKPLEIAETTMELGFLKRNRIRTVEMMVKTNSWVWVWVGWFQNLFQLERCGDKIDKIDKIEIDKSQDHEHQVVLFSNSFFANLGWVKFAIGPWALGLGPWALASIVWISVDQNHGTGVSLEAPDFDPQMAQCLRTWWTSREKRRCNNGTHPGGFGASICHGSKGVILLLDHRIFGGPKRNVTPRAPQSATFCRTRLAVETFKEDLHQPPHPRRRIVPNIRMFQVSLFVSTANCPKETGPPSVVTLKISSSYMLQIITGWKPPCRGSVSTLGRYTVIFSWWWLVLQHIPGIYAWVERTEFASRPSLKLSAPFTGYVGYQSVLILL